MRSAVFLAAALLLSSCTTTEIEPIPGSIIYGGQPRTKLTKSPVGSTFTHTFLDQRGNRWTETYRIEADRTLKLIARRASIEFTLNADGRL